MKTQPCNKCGLIKVESEFPFRSLAKNIRKKMCKECLRPNGKAHYLRYKDYYIEKSRRRMLAIRSELRVNVFAYLSEHPCVDCGEADVVVLEFDHVKGIKKGNISAMMQQGFSWEAVLEEINKCEVRCANCHRRATYRRAKSYRFYLDVG